MFSSYFLPIKWCIFIFTQILMSTFAHIIVLNVLLTFHKSSSFQFHVKSSKEFIMLNPIYPDWSNVIYRLIFLENFLRFTLQRVWIRHQIRIDPNNLRVIWVWWMMKWKQKQFLLTKYDIHYLYFLWSNDWFSDSIAVSFFHKNLLGNRTYDIWCIIHLNYKRKFMKCIKL